MTIEQDIFAMLKVDPNLSALVGTRIYPVDFPQRATFPLVVYTRISALMVLSHNLGASMAFARLQFSIWAQSYSGAKEVEAALMAALNGSKPSPGSAVLPVDLRESRDAEGLLYRIDLDCQVNHRI